MSSKNLYARVAQLVKTAVAKKAPTPLETLPISCNMLVLNPLERLRRR
jgi:hypothetical protein